MAVGTNYEFRYTLNGRASYECTETTLFSGRQPCPLGKRGERLRDEVGAMLARLYILQGEPQVVDLIEKPDVEIRFWAAGTGYGAKEAEGVILDMLREGNREGKAHAYTRMSGGVFVSIPDPEKLRLARDERMFSPVKEELKTLAEIETGLVEAVQPFADQLQQLVSTLEGKQFDSFEAKHRIATMVQDIADRLRLAFLCPKCGGPARFLSSQNKTAKSGVFVFSHGKQTHGGRTAFPALKLTAAPPDRRKLKGVASE